ncbi:unnamed protein product [Pleuronectes platessa]|uniref:Uncharacterized protein n=1 Tax=Pleuronectes platessa TaxID=8262 RepID=A0A9N7THW9_PLEPL|nr:unnamed protein product [Pleuronectes platessa]
MGGAFGVQHLARGHFGMQMGQTGDRTADLQQPITEARPGGFSGYARRRLEADPGAVSAPPEPARPVCKRSSTGSTAPEPVITPSWHRKSNSAIALAAREAPGCNSTFNSRRGQTRR